MTMNNNGIIPCLIAIVFLFASSAHGYDNVITHRTITEKGSEYSTAQTREFLKEKLGFQKGYETVIMNRRLIDWLKEGSYLEDVPNCRASNHFHNPLLPWDQSYMTDQPSWLNTVCSDWKPWYSAVTWAIGYTAPSPQGAKISFPRITPLTWDKARDSFYQALTLTSVADRNIYLAWAFESLGSTIHVLQDMAVPAHVRNDFNSHLEYNGITSMNPLDWYIQRYEKYVQLNPNLVALYPPVFPSFFSAALTNYWDTDSYNGSNPSTSNASGLAEFTNANYLSDSTIPSNNPTVDHVFPYPYIRSSNVSGDGYQICTDYSHDSMKARKYISRKNKGSCPPLSEERKADHFAVASLFNHESLITDENVANLRLWLDNNVHNTYAKELLPRAVGYSAALLDYFFRGNVEVTLPTSAIYAFTGNRDNGFTRITLNAKNTTGNNEEMPDGSIELVARYRTVQSDPFQPFDLRASNDFTYVVVPEANSRRAIPRNSTVELVFDRGQTAIIPANAVDISLQVVYHGRLGNEDGAVAVGMKGLSDPTPVERINNMDKICLNGQWYSAGSQAAIDQVDLDHNGIPNWDIYPHDLANIFIKISPAGYPIQASASDYTLKSDTLNAGTLIRAFVLGDSDSLINHSHIITVIKTATSDTFTHAGNIFNGIWPGSLIKSEIESSSVAADCNSYGFASPCTIRHAPPFYSFRNNYLWGSTAVIFDNPVYPIDTFCDWQALH